LPILVMAIVSIDRMFMTAYTAKREGIIPATVRVSTRGLTRQAEFDGR
jgi:hypothetical protein